MFGSSLIPPMRMQYITLLGECYNQMFEKHATINAKQSKISLANKATDVKPNGRPPLEDEAIFCIGACHIEVARLNAEKDVSMDYIY
jgi:hypothetical protein